MKAWLLKYWWVILIVALLLIGTFFYFKNRKRKNMSQSDYDKFFNELVTFVQAKEGGLSNNPNDTAAAYPSPTPEKWHTNKGITWRNFKDYAPSLGYDPTVANFLAMPNDIWLKIFNKKYIDKTKNISNNPVLNSYIALWLWGGWYKGFVTDKQVAEIVVADISDKEKLRKLVDLRKIYFDKVIAANPVQAAFENGWKNRAEDFYNTFNKYLA